MLVARHASFEVFSSFVDTLKVRLWQGKLYLPKVALSNKISLLHVPSIIQDNQAKQVFWRGLNEYQFCELFIHEQK